MERKYDGISQANSNKILTYIIKKIADNSSENIRGTKVNP